MRPILQALAIRYDVSEVQAILRILHVIPTYYPAVRYGGPIVAVHGLARGLAARGHEVEVYTTNVDGAGYRETSSKTKVLFDGVNVSYFSSNFMRRLFWSPDFRTTCNREIGKFDLVHLHSVFLLPTLIAARAAKRTCVPYLVSPRGMLVDDLIRRRSTTAKKLWMNLFERKTFRQAAAIHVTSELEGEELRRLGWELPTIATIANGVDEPSSVTDSEVMTDVRKLSRRQPLILFLGRLSWKKGLDRLLDAFALTTSGYLVIAGTDDEKLSLSLTKQVERLGLSDRVSILPRTIGGSDKEYLFASARLFVLPSYSENFGNTVLEAMRRGLPAVVTPEVGAAQIVSQSGGGVVVPGDPTKLGEALEMLLADRELSTKMGQAAQCHVKNGYGWESIVERMEALYRTIVEEASALESFRKSTSEHFGSISDSNSHEQ